MRTPKMAATITNEGVALHPARLPKWYRAQRAGWAVLERQGWQFFGPGRKSSEGVALGMRRRGVVCIATIRQARTFRALHTSLLAACEEMARKAS